MRIATLQDIEKLEETPIEEAIPYSSTYEMILAGAKGREDRPALHFIRNGAAYKEPITLTYAQLIGRIHQTANFLHSLGIGPRDVVSFLLPNLPQTHFLLWGGELAGIINPINPLLQPAAIAGILKAAGTKVLVALGPQPGTDIWDKVEQIRDKVPSLEKVVQVAGPGDPQRGIISYDAVINDFPADHLEAPRKIAPDDIAAYFHTGGTTGVPKLAQHTHFMEIHNAWAMDILVDISDKDVFLCGLPLFHVNAVLVTGLAPFARGATVVLLGPAGFRDPEVIKNFFRIVEHYRGTFFSAVPTVYSALLQVPTEGTDVTTLKYAICGAAPMPVETFRAFERKTGIKILEGYGLTEGACASAVNPRDGERRVGSIGLRFPYQPMKTVILDEQGNYVRDAEPDEQGIIVIKGPNVFPGYVQEEHNQGIWIGEERWFNTGDLGRMDQEGYFWITGRAKDLIIRGGHNIDPAWIEEPLYEHPAVALAAAVGKPDAYAGEVPVAYVTLKPGESVSEGELKSYLAEKIAERAALPKEIYIVPQIDVTPVGKIFKPALRWDAARRAFSELLADLPEKVEVEVGPHPVHGTYVKFKLPDEADRERLTQAIQERMKPFVVRYEIE